MMKDLDSYWYLKFGSQRNMKMDTLWYELRPDSQQNPVSKFQRTR